MEPYIILLALVVLCGAWNVFATLNIFVALKNWGKPVSFTFLRLMAPKYAFDYREITRKEIGRAGGYFYHWIISINMALLFAILALVSYYW